MTKLIPLLSPQLIFILTKVLIEIVDSERSYVEQMKLTVNSYLKPMRRNKILGEEEVRVGEERGERAISSWRREKRQYLVIKKCSLRFSVLFLIPPSPQIRMIFGNFEEVYQKNKALLKTLQTAFQQWPEVNEFPAIFLQLHSLLDVYTVFILHYPSGAAYLKEKSKDKKVAAFLRGANREVGEGRDLEHHFLIMPVQV